MAQVCPKLRAFHTELLPLLERAHKIDSNDLKSLVDEMSACVGHVKHHIEHEPPVTELDGEQVVDEFHTAARQWVGKWEGKIASLELEFNHMEEELDRMVQYIAHPHMLQQHTSQQIFGFLDFFLTAYRRSYDEAPASPIPNPAAPPPPCSQDRGP